MHLILNVFSLRYRICLSAESGCPIFQGNAHGPLKKDARINLKITRCIFTSQCAGLEIKRLFFAVSTFLFFSRHQSKNVCFPQTAVKVQKIWFPSLFVVTLNSCGCLYKIPFAARPGCNCPVCLHLRNISRCIFRALPPASQMLFPAFVE